jgi:leucyl aminopeptidase
LAPLLAAKCTRLLADVRGVGGAPWSDALVSAHAAASYEGPRYRKAESKKDRKTTQLVLWVAARERAAAEKAAAAASALAEGTNLVRRLATMAGNDLTTDRYVALATEIAKEAGLKTEFVDFDKLKALGAGAFCAVAQAAKGRSGILKIHYEPKGAAKRVAFVGKGITYDTGGAQLKPGEHMFGMHGDMGGSAVALALVLYAAKTKAPYRASAYLAITDNQFSPDSYRPNDVVTSLSGKTIEVVDTDAEGRMVLADTLTLAGRDKPDLMVDFATLTGSCVKAIGTNYSGAYSNRRRLLSVIRAAGRASGERAWAFPNDPDYGRCLKSSYADLKQCRLKGGVDHIEASYFLRQFVDKTIPYVHVDLSAIENEGGLAHVPTEHTGFGVRFGAELVARAL